jgi:hypothetical protein
MGQVYQRWRRICREINVFPRFEYHMFYVLYPFVSYLLTLPRKRRALHKELQNDGLFLRISKRYIHMRLFSVYLRYSNCTGLSNG